MKCNKAIIAIKKTPPFRLVVARDSIHIASPALVVLRKMAVVQILACGRDKQKRGMLGKRG
jgi:hypothetical protein